MIRRTSLLLSLLGVLLVVATGNARACQICLPFPTESLADHILASEHLVLARENPDKPFTLQTITWLKKGAGAPAPVELFLDSSSRRRLSRDETLSILCGWSPETEKWRRLAFHDSVLAPVVGEILRNAETWGEETTPDRVRYFADYLGHENATLADLAHIEVARAPYATLMRYSDRLPRGKLLSQLGNFRLMEWHALYILFLGRSSNPGDQERIRREIAQSAELGQVILTAAWATAFLELDGTAALERLRQWYGAGSIRRLEEREAVLAALVVHGNEGDPALRDPVVALLGEFLKTDPELAPDIAASLAKWNRDDFVEPVADLLRESSDQFDLEATVILRRYLQESAERKVVESPVSKRNAPILPVLLLIGLVVVAVFLGFLRRPRSGEVSTSREGPPFDRPNSRLALDSPELSSPGNGEDDKQRLR